MSAPNPMLALRAHAEDLDVKLHEELDVELYNALSRSSLAANDAEKKRQLTTFLNRYAEKNGELPAIFSNLPSSNEAALQQENDSLTETVEELRQQLAAAQAENRRLALPSAPTTPDPEKYVEVGALTDLKQKVADAEADKATAEADKAEAERQLAALQQEFGTYRQRAVPKADLDAEKAAHDNTVRKVAEQHTVIDTVLNGVKRRGNGALIPGDQFDRLADATDAIEKLVKPAQAESTGPIPPVTVVPHERTMPTP